MPDESTTQPMGPGEQARANPAVRIRFVTETDMRYYVREAVAHDGLDFTSYRLADVAGWAHKMPDGWVVVLEGQPERVRVRMQVQFLEDWLRELIDLRDKAQDATPGDDSVPIPTE